MVSQENYQLNYDIFLAEQELFDSLFVLGCGVVNESVGLISLQEGFKETIMNYLEKITKAIESAWEKFKQLLLEGKDKVYLKAIEKKMENPNPKFTIDNFKTFDTTFLDNISVKPFDYTQMKESLESKTDYINKYYSNLIKDPQVGIKENIMNSIVKSTQDNVRCTSDMLKNMYTFATKTFTAKVSKLEVDLKTVNNSNKNIQNLISTIQPAEVKAESVCIYESYIMEAEEKKDDKPKFNNDEPEKSSQDNSTLVKHVSTYLGVSSDIISAKMSAYREVYAFYMSVIKNYIKPSGTSEEKQEKPVDNNAGEKKTEINI